MRTSSSHEKKKTVLIYHLLSFRTSTASAFVEGVSSDLLNLENCSKYSLGWSRFWTVYKYWIFETLSLRSIGTGQTKFEYIFVIFNFVMQEEVTSSLLYFWTLRRNIEDYMPYDANRVWFYLMISLLFDSFFKIENSSRRE